MKKIIVLLNVIMLSAGYSYSQESQVQVQVNEYAFNQGDLLLNAGFSFAYYGQTFGGTRSLGIIPLSVNLEYGIHKYISVGPYLGYASWDYDIGNDFTWNILSLGARGSFHYLPLLDEILESDLDLERLDFYASLILGLEIQSSNPNIIENETELVLGPVLGFKYLFNERVGAYFEGGRGTFGYGTLGVAFVF